MQIYNIETDQDGQELTTHGTSDFPCAFYDEWFSAFVDQEVAWHWHEEAELIYVAEGAAKVECIEQSQTLQAGDAAFINANALHRITNARCSDSRILNIVFNPQLIGGLNFSRVYQQYVYPVITNKQNPLQLFSRSSPCQHAMMEALERAFHAWQTQPEGYEFVVSIALMTFWYQLCEYRPQIRSTELVSPTNERRIQQILAYIQQHYTENVSIASISHAANISESECYRLFKQTLHCTPNHYLLTYRLRRAAGLLSKSTLPITDIAYKTGFNSPAYFAKKFKVAYGKTPRQFRHKN